MGRFRNYYTLLEIGYTADRGEIKRAYQQALTKYQGDPARIAIIREAWGVLGDANLRAKYDDNPEIKAKKREARHRSAIGGRTPKTQVMPLPSPPPNVAKTQILSMYPSGATVGSETVVRRISYPPLRIEVRQPDGMVRERVFEQEQIFIGRSSTQDIVLDDETRYVSRKHARIEVQDSSFYLSDTSINGTRVNGRKLEKGESYLLSDGDTIGIEGWRLTVHFD